MDTFGEYAFQVRSYECGPDGYATLATICNYLQEAASLNAESLKFSKSNFEAAGENISWVLTRMRVRMSQYPRWEDAVSVLTFPRGGRRITAWRDFEIKAADGRVLGVATSEWMLIDLASRKVVPIPESVFDLANTVREPVLGADPWTLRLRFPQEGAGERFVFKAQNSHIDLNGHVNNVHYVEWMLEAADASPSEIDIVFRQAAKAGDALVSERCAADGGRSLHAIRRPSDNAILATAAIAIGRNGQR